MKTSILQLDDLVTVVYCALDDALADAGIKAVNGKLIPRRGPAPEVDDREVACLAVVQELLHFESDNHFHLWLSNNETMRELFPRRLSRQNFAERRTLLTPILQKLCGAFCNLVGDGQPPFSSSTAIPSMFAAPLAPKVAMYGSAVSPKSAAARVPAAGIVACANT